MSFSGEKGKRQRFDSDTKALLTTKDIRARQRALEHITNDKAYSHLQMGSAEFFRKLNDLIAAEKQNPTVDNKKDDKTRLERRRHTLAVVQGLSNMHAFLGMPSHSDNEFSEIDEESLSPMLDKPEMFVRRHSMVDLNELRERHEASLFENVDFDEIFISDELLPEEKRHKLPPLPKTPFISEEKAVVEKEEPYFEEIWEATQPNQSFSSPIESQIEELEDKFCVEDAQSTTKKPSAITVSTQRTV
eukprot:TRINITY_DN3143_c3_g2_i1.p1 TRINITY_DN3143_c3_g2~~TRINITY_DN3143_c3_g2_i1.p1  ORF type:complete len:246 (+),score=87.24 TRINITY_DN3143_c3_g2_i1:153-890(+)